MRKINRRNFLKAAGVVAAASALAACGGNSGSSTAASTGSTAGSAAGADGAKAYNELTVGTDNTDLTAEIKIISNRTDLIDDGTFDGYIAEFQKQYPNITIKYEGMTNYADDMTTRLTSKDWGDVCMIPTTIPLTELGDYFEPLCSLDAINDEYNFASNRSYDGTVYGIPSTGNAQGIVYNKKVFEAAGVTTLPKTPDEFLDALQKIKDYDASIDPLYTNYAAGWTMSAWDTYIGGGATADPDWMNITMPQTKDPFQKGIWLAVDYYEGDVSLQKLMQSSEDKLNSDFYLAESTIFLVDDPAAMEQKYGCFQKLDGTDPAEGDTLSVTDFAVPLADTALAGAAAEDGTVWYAARRLNEGMDADAVSRTRTLWEALV